MIYFDNAATTKIYSKTLEFMKEYSETQTNPKDKSSANESVAESEDGIPDFLNKPCKPQNIVQKYKK